MCKNRHMNRTVKKIQHYSIFCVFKTGFDKEYLTNMESVSSSMLEMHYFRSIWENISDI